MVIQGKVEQLQRGEPADKGNMSELQNSPCFSSVPCILNKNSLVAHPNQKYTEKGILGNAFGLAKLTHYKATINNIP